MLEHDAWIVAVSKLLGDSKLSTTERSTHLSPVLRLATEFNVIYMDSQSAAKWNEAGWELRNYDSNDEVQLALAEWKASSGKPKLFLVKRPA